MNDKIDPKTDEQTPAGLKVKFAQFLVLPEIFNITMTPLRSRFRLNHDDIDNVI